MTWSRFDDGYDEHDKIDDAWFAFPPNPVGLHVQATTACNRWLSDGVLKPRWITYKLPDAKQRALILAAMVEHGLFDHLAAGERRVLVDGDGNEITVGPFRDDRYVVHDFLDRHDSSVQTKARRAADAERKRLSRGKDSKRPPVGHQPDSAGRPEDGAADSAGSPLTGGGASASPRPDPALPDPALPDPISTAAREHTRIEVEEIATTIGALADRHNRPTPSVDDVADVLAEYPDRNITAALDSLKQWCSRSSRPDHMLGAFRSTLSKAPRRAPASRPVRIHAAPSDEHRANWAAGVERLQERVPETVYAVYLAELELVGVTGDQEFVLACPGALLDLIAQRHVPLVADVVGRPVHLVPAAAGAAA